MNKQTADKKKPAAKKTAAKKPAARKKPSVKKKASKGNRIDRLNNCIAKALSVLTPPEDITVSEWADRYRRLSNEASAETGRWRTSRTPYLKEIMDAFTDPKVRNIVLVAASQVGKSEFENNIIGYIIDEDPGSILFIMPTVTDAKDYSQLRIAPMIRDCPTLNAKVADPKSRDSGNTILQKRYPGGILTLTGSGEAHALASKPIRYVIGDERDRWAVSAGDEGDPWKLAQKRQTTFYNAKSIEVSTPTIKGKSRIEKSFNKGTMERYHSQCPHCGEFSEIKFSDIRFDYETKEIEKKKTFDIKSFFYVCPKCGAVSDEITMKRAPAKWIPQNPDAYKNGTRSFWLSAFVSPWADWKHIIQEFLEAQGDTNLLKPVYNTHFGELWEERGDIEDEDSVIGRREPYGDAELPDGVLVLTCGIDTQDDRLEYEVVGHGHFGETWGIRRGIIMGRPDSDEVWQAVDDLLDHEFAFANGVKLKISLTFQDEGGHFTQVVREQCQKRQAKKLFCIKGIGGSDKPYTSPPKKQSIVVNQRIVGYAWQYQIGVDAGKQMIMDNIKVQTPGPKYCHFPIRDDYGYAFFHGLLSEHLVYDPKKKNPWQWAKIPGHERNEALDCRNYAMAAFVSLPKDLDAIERRIKEGRTLTAPPPQRQQPKPKKRSNNRYLDEW